MKYFFGYLFLFLFGLVLLVALARPDLLEAALLTTGVVLVATAYVIVGGLGLAVFIGGALVAWWWYRRTTVESLRQRDGHYPIQRIRVAGGRTVFIDPNQTIGPAIMVNRKTGEIYEHEPAAGWHIQATIRGMVEQTRRAQATFQGDASRSTQWGSQSKGDRITAPAAKLIAGGYDRQSAASAFNTPPAVDSLAAPLAEPVRALTAREGLGANTNTRLALGQTADGKIVMWDMTQVPHLRFHGQTQGSGKTNALQTVAAGAARLGAHVMVLDRRSFKDWGEFRGVAELIDSRDPRTFAAAVRALQALYQERDRQLGAAGAANIMALRDTPRRVLAIVSEFGALCDVAAAEGVLDQVLGPLKLILREAGATGVHMLLEDQVVDRRWPRGISTNAEPVTGYLPLNYGAAGGYYNAHQLQAYQFHFGGSVFKTWHMQPELRSLLAAAPDLGEPIVGSSPSVSQSVPKGVSQSVSEPLPDVTYTPVSTGNTGNANDPGKWYEWILDYMSRSEGRELWQVPPKGVRVLARAMSKMDTGSEANEDGYVGIASKVTKRIREEAHLSNGDKLGTDVASNGGRDVV